MAIIKEMPGRKIIDGFKGKLDFYYYMGVPVCRKWPRSQGKSQTPASIAQWPMFTYVAQSWITISPFVREAYYSIAADCGLHAKDWFTRGYITG
ncbi:unnamed protein product, partial [marine sediment metagenome]